MSAPMTRDVADLIALHTDGSAAATVRALTTAAVPRPAVQPTDQQRFDTVGLPRYTTIGAHR